VSSVVLGVFKYCLYIPIYRTSLLSGSLVTQCAKTFVITKKVEKFYGCKMSLQNVKNAVLVLCLLYSQGKVYLVSDHCLTPPQPHRQEVYVKGQCHEIENGYNWYQKTDQKTLSVARAHF
jgi:hypothetical protein